MLPRLLLLSLLWQSAQSAQSPAQQKSPRKTAPKPSAPAASTRAATPAVPDKFQLRVLTVRGNTRLTQEQILAAAGLEINQLQGKADFDAARDRLLATGMFETVGYQFAPAADGQGYTANFDVMEIPAVFPIEFENLAAPKGEIEGFLRGKNVLYLPEIPGTTQVLDMYARQIEQFLASRNHPVKVVAGLVPIGKDKFKILFRSGEPLPAVSTVTFSGNQAVSAITLQNAIGNVAFGQPFTRDGFRLLLDNQIRPLYDARGLVRVKFPMFTTEPDPRVKGVKVHVTVEEGPVYKLGKVGISGGDVDLLKAAKMKIKTGDTVNFDEIGATLDRIKEQLKHGGYLHVEGTVDRDIDDKNKTVNVKLILDKGPQFKFGKLTIRGLDLNSEPAVRKLWATREGNPFNPSYPDYFLQRIREDGMFDGLGTTKATAEINEETHIADVTLIFGASPAPKKPKRPGQIEDTEEPKKPEPPWD